MLENKNLLVLAGAMAFVLIAFFYMSSNGREINTDSGNKSASPMKEIEGELYIDPTYGYQIIVPEGYRVDKNGDYSIQILPDLQTIGVGSANFIYVSVVTPEMRENNGEVYNYNPQHYQKLISLKEVGESTNFAEGDIPEMSDWFEYTLVQVEDIDGAMVKNFENTRPWGFPGGTTENRFIYDTGENIYILGYYTGGDSVDGAASINPKDAYSVILSFQTN